jgi:hypothetical protein
LWLRQKVAGVWQAWVAQAPSLGNLDTRFVNVTGDTMSGGLTLSGSSGVTAGGAVIAGNAGTTGGYYFGNTGTKSLTYDGSGFILAGGPAYINTGALTVGNAGTTGTYYFGNTVTKYLQFDGTNFLLSGGPLTVGGTLTSSNTTINFDMAAVWGKVMVPTSSSIANGAVLFGKFGGGAAGTITYGASQNTVAYNTSSDGRLKEDLKSFDAGNIVDDTVVYDFAWKDTAERSYGVIAQQAIDVYPAAVTYIESSDWYGIDYSKYVPVLLQELKALRARVADLEGRLDMKPQPA